MPIRRRSLLAALFVSWLAACEATPPPVGTPGTAQAPRAVNVIMRDFLFEPRPIRLVPGETVRFTVINAGLVAHDFVLGDETVQAAWAAADAAATAPIIGATAPPASVSPDPGGLRVWLASGATSAATFTVPGIDEASALRLTCRIPGHIEEGMVGELELVR